MTQIPIRRCIAKLCAFCALTALLGFGGTAVSGAQEGPGVRSAAREQANVVREVRHQLAMMPHYTVFDWITYTVSGNNVTLNGQVAVPVNKDDAQAAVKSVEGVGQINNQIKVLPPSPMDDQLRRAEYRAIFGFDSLSKYGFMNIPSIHIIVEGGHVTLYGVVDNQADKDAANIRANGVPNVFSVTNNLTVGTGK